MKKISVITCIYNEEEIVKDVYFEIKRVFSALKDKYDYEHLFLDNCSSDNTATILKEIAKEDKRVKVIIYSKNFGSMKSEMTGYRHASGDAIVAFEGSLKDPADLIPTFIKYWEEGYEVVYGVRTSTPDNFILASTRKIFYWLVDSMSEEQLPRNAGVFRLVDRCAVDELVKIDDYKPYIRGLITSVGFKQIGIEYVRGPRLKGKSKSDWNHLIGSAINAIISYSITPIRLCTYIGLSLAVLSFATAIVYLALKLLFQNAQVPAVAAVIILILLFSGIQLFFLGIIGEYVGAIHSQVRRKPFVVIRERINF